MSKGSKYTVQNQIYLMVHMLKESKVPCIDSNNSNTFHCTHVKRVESTYIVYSCEPNDSMSESNEVHTLELTLLMFITLSTM